MTARPLLAGVGVASLAAGLAGGTVLALEMLRRSPAERAGLLPGDVVLALDGQPIQDAAQLRNELARAAAGSTPHPSVRREGQRKEIAIQVEEAAGDGA
jgi:S1-C subfamily serine protease